MKPNIPLTLKLLPIPLTDEVYAPTFSDNSMLPIVPKNNLDKYKPKIVDVNDTCSFVSVESDLHSCPPLLSLPDYRALTVLKPLDVIVPSSKSTPTIGNSRRQSRFVVKLPVQKNAPTLLMCSHQDSSIQTDQISLDSILDYIIPLLLAVTVDRAFCFILNLIRSRFPNARILKLLPEFIKILVTGVNPRCWSKPTLLASLRVKIRAGVKLYNNLRTKFGFPFPCVSSVNRFVQSVFFVFREYRSIQLSICREFFTIQTSLKRQLSL